MSNAYEEDPENCWAYEHAIILSEELLDNVLKLWPGRSFGADTVQMKLKQKRLSIGDVPVLQRKLKSERVIGRVERWVIGHSEEHLEADDMLMEDRTNSVLWMLRPVMQLELLLRQERDALLSLSLGHWPARQGPPTHDDERQSIVVPDAASAAAAVAADDHEGGEECAASAAQQLTTTLPIELLVHILRRLSLPDLVSFGLASRKASSRLHELLVHDATPEGLAIWERWGKLGGAYYLVDWDGVDFWNARNGAAAGSIDVGVGGGGGMSVHEHASQSLGETTGSADAEAAAQWTPIRTRSPGEGDEEAPRDWRYPVARKQLRDAFCTRLRRVLAAATCYDPPAAVAVELLTLWSKLLHATRPLPTSDDCSFTRAWFTEWGLGARAIGLLARRWRARRRWSCSSLVELVRGGVYGGMPLPYESLPSTPPLKDVDYFQRDETGRHGVWDASGREHMAVPEHARWAGCMHAFSSHTLEAYLMDQLLQTVNQRQFVRLTNGMGGWSWAPADATYPRCIAKRGHGAAASRDGPRVVYMREADERAPERILAHRMLESLTGTPTRTPSSLQLPADLLLLRVRAEANWRKDWLLTRRRHATAAADAFHQVLRLSGESDVPAVKEESSPPRVVVRLYNLFGRVSLYVRALPPEDEEEGDMSANEKAARQLAREHRYQTPMVADLEMGASEASSLITAFLGGAAKPQNESSECVAEFLFALHCSRLGPPSRRDNRLSHHEQTRYFANRSQLTELGTRLADLELSLPHVAALLAALRPSTTSSSSSSISRRELRLVFRTWARRARFPSAWRWVDSGSLDSGDVWRHFRGLGLSLAPRAREDVGRAGGGLEDDIHGGSAASGSSGNESPASQGEDDW